MPTSLVRESVMKPCNRLALWAGSVGLSLAIPSHSTAQYYQITPRTMVYPYYQGANAIYRHYRPYDIGSPMFFRRNLPPPSWNYYSRSTGGIFVRPRNCYGPYC